MDPRKTGNIIAEARRNNNMTQAELAEKLYVSDKAVSKWERGICFPDIATLIPLTEILNISLYDLLRGEKMKNNEDINNTLKDTIKYSNSELKRNKKKNIIISSIIIFIIIIISSIIIININNNEMKSIVEKDTIYDIYYYKEYKTSLNNESGSNIEKILMRLPLNWIERNYILGSDNITINYSITYNEVVNTYKDKGYVDKAIIDISTVLFTTVSDVNNISIKFKDNKYTITRDNLLKVYNISSFEELLDNNTWKDIVSTKLEDSNFINNTFDLFFKM